MLGIRDVSRTLEFRASYTLVEHAPADSMELEIKPYALAADGFLVERDGEVFSGSDWIPLDSASVNLPSDRLLSVRYPIRTKEDLLPVTRLTTSEMLPLLMERLAKAGCSMTGTEALDKIIEPQLRLRGTLTMHSETARRNGGDYDFDYICLV